MGYKDRLLVRIKDEDALRQKMEPVFQKLMQESASKQFNLGDMYWGAEWIFGVDYEGFMPFDVKLSERHESNGVTFYTYGYIYRKLFLWEIFSTEEDCQQACDAFNAYGDDYATYRCLFEQDIYPSEAKTD